MDTILATLATGLSQSKLDNSVQIDVARKTLDAERQQGSAMVKLIDSATRLSPPGVGTNLDVAA